MQRLSPLDLMALWPDEVGQWQDMGAIAVVGPRPDGLAFDDAWVDALRWHVASRLDRTPRLRQVLHVPPPGLGRPLWVDAQRFDVRDHVRVHPVPAPGTERQVLDAVEDLRRRRLDPARPLWQAWLLTGVDDGARCALYLRVHHALADGPSAVMMIAALHFDAEPRQSLEGPPPSPWTPEPTPPARELLRDNLQHCGACLAQTLEHARHPRGLTSRARRAVATLRTMQAGAEPPSGLLAPLGAGRRLAVVSTDVDTLASAARTEGGTVNDALLAVIAGGVRTLLAARGQRVGGLELRAIVPVALPHAEGDDTGNRLGQIIVPLPVGTPGVRDRLATITARTRDLKPAATTRRPVVLRGRRLQRTAMRFAARQRLYSVYVANLPGPRTPLHLLDAPVAALSPVVPLLGNLTLGVGALSYAGDFSILTVADRDTCPDLDVFVDGLTQALAELRG
ncbi:MAG: wax ester/triacylglycerol synthase family O-acyltransferase [Nocardioidaceae bacterium]